MPTDPAEYGIGDEIDTIVLSQDPTTLTPAYAGDPDDSDDASGQAEPVVEPQVLPKSAPEPEPITVWPDPDPFLSKINLAKTKFCQGHFQTNSLCI